MNNVLAGHHRFIGHLERLVREKDRGALAALRRGLGKPPISAREMDRYIMPYLPAEAAESAETSYYLVGALFAYWYQGKDALYPAEGNLGDSLRRLVNHETIETGNREDAEKRVEKRLVALLNCHRDDIPVHLRQVIGLLKSKDIPVDWTQLLRDVQNWQWQSRDVQREWARKFWRGYDKGTSLDETQSQNENNVEEE